ncbi:hypothetical protein ACFL2U_00315 [Patescibacteria group bacterium]
MNKKYYLIVFSLIITLSLVLILSQECLAALNFSNAVPLTEQGATAAGVSKASDPSALAASVVSALLSLVGVIFFILFIYGGFIWMTAGGNDERVGKAKKIIASAVIGLAIVSLAYVISFFIIQALETPPV